MPPRSRRRCTHRGGAPRRPIELGVDAALTYESGDEASATTFTVPVPRLRVGFFVSDALSIEPTFSLQYTRLEVDNDILEDETVSFTQYDFALGLLYHFNSDRARSQPFLRPFVGIRGVSGEDNSASQPILGAAFGLKMPSTNRIGTRLEAGFAHRFEDEPVFESSNQIFVAVGLSFFTR